MWQLKELTIMWNDSTEALFRHNSETSLFQIPSTLSRTLRSLSCSGIVAIFMTRGKKWHKNILFGWKKFNIYSWFYQVIKQQHKHTHRGLQTQTALLHWKTLKLQAHRFKYKAFPDIYSFLESKVYLLCIMWGNYTNIV